MKQGPIRRWNVFQSWAFLLVTDDLVLLSIVGTRCHNCLLNNNASLFVFWSSKVGEFDVLKMCRLLAFWIALIFVPVRPEGSVGQSVARFICKYVPAYFPMRVVFEDESAFNVKQSYGEWYLHTCSGVGRCYTN